MAVRLELPPTAVDHEGRGEGASFGEGKRRGFGNHHGNLDRFAAPVNVVRNVRQFRCDREKTPLYG